VRKDHLRLAFACEGARGGGGAAPLKCEKNLAREVEETEIHLQLAFAHEGGGRRRNGGKMRQRLTSKLPLHAREVCGAREREVCILTHFQC
jgi:hypothetical protein